MITLFFSLGIVSNLLSLVCGYSDLQPILTDALQAALSSRDCHLPLSPRSPEEDKDLEEDGENGDEEQGRLNQRVRFLPEEENPPRASEEEVAWRAAQV